MANDPRAEARSRARERALRHRQAVVRRRRVVAGVAGTVLVAISAYGLIALAVGGGTSTAGGGGGPGPPATEASSCTALKLGDGATVTRLQTPGGTCESTRRLAYYTCPATPRVPTVTAEEGGTTHRYLGGPLATTVATRPPGLELLGEAGHVKVYRRPATGAVYVSDKPGALSGWLTAPSAAPATPSAYFLGDSVMLGAQPWVKRDLGSRWTVDFDAHVDRSTAQGLGIVTAHGGRLGDAAVIQLGTNDGGRPAYYIGQVDRILEALHGMPVVVWLTIAHARSYYATDDQMLRTAVARFPNALVADWAGVATPADVYGDGLHLTPDGGKAMARLAAGTLNEWRQAALGAAARACAQHVAAAA